MMDLTTLALIAALCTVPYLGMMFLIARLATRPRLRFAARLRRGVENGDYDAQSHPQRAKQIRAFILVTSSMVVVTCLLIMAILSSYAYPEFFAETIGFNRAEMAVTAWLLFSGVSVIVLNQVIQRIMGNGRG